MLEQTLSARLHQTLKAPLLFYLFLGAAIAAGAAMAFLGAVEASGAFVLLGLLALFAVRIDLCVLLLLLVRSSLDFSTEYSLLSLAPTAKLNVAAVLNLLLVLAGTIHLVRTGTRIWRLPGVRFFVIFLIACLLSFPQAPSLPAAIADWLRNLSCLIIYAVVATVFTDAHRARKVLGFILLSAVIPVSVGFYQKSVGEGVLSLPGFYRIYATFFHPTAYGLYLILIIMLIYLVLHLQESLFHRAGLFLLLFCSSVSLLWTYSRGAWIAALVAAAVIAAISRWKSAFAGIGAIAALAVLLPQIPQRFEDVAGATSRGSFQWRVWLWKRMVPLIWVSPLVGHGLGSFPFYAEGRAAHNDYVRLLFEVGILGFVFYLLTILAVGLFAVRQTGRDREPLTRILSMGFVAILAGFLAASAGQNVITAPALQWYLWSLAGLVVSLGSTQQAPVKQ